LAVHTIALALYHRGIASASLAEHFACKTALILWPQCLR
jgi:hypothetical protein